VVDLRSLAPMDVATVAESVGRTGRLVLVQEGPLAGGWAATLLTRMVAAGADTGSRPAVVTSDDAPVPYATGPESAWLPDVERIVAAATQLAEASLWATS
jgi:pyruvate/2-oxoglutarate/acetoin dehydrogenase E1 component